MGERGWDRLAASSGILFVVMLMLSTFMVPRLPAADDAARDIATFFSDHRDAGLAASYFMGIGGILALWFFSVLYGVLRRAEGDGGHLSMAALVAGVTTVAIVIGVDAIRTSFYLRTGQEGDPATVKALYNVSSTALYYASFALALFLVTASAVMIRTRALSPLLGWVGVLFAAVQLVAAGAVAGGVTHLGLVALLSFALWVVAASVALMGVIPRYATRASG
jgi:hypothetical protein